MIVLAVDLVLALVPLEMVVLLVIHRRGGGPGPVPLLANAAAGLCLAAALRLALVGADPSGPAQAGLAALLAMAGLAHVADLAARRR